MAETKRELMSIGQVARAAGVAATALRYYEREGVLLPTVRSGTGYRLYDSRAVEQLEFIRAAQAVGFTLDDIRVLLDVDAEQKRTCRKDVQALIEKRLGEVEQKMKDLRRVQAALGEALQKCRHADGECPVLKRLHEHDQSSKKKVKHGDRTNGKP